MDLPAVQPAPPPPVEAPESSNGSPPPLSSPQDLSLSSLALDPHPADSTLDSDGPTTPLSPTNDNSPLPNDSFIDSDTTPRPKQPGVNDTGKPAIAQAPPPSSMSGSALGQDHGQHGADENYPFETPDNSTAFNFSSMSYAPAGANGGAAQLLQSQHSGQAGQPIRKNYHRHMARSALKRDSVRALPPIRDLQLRFSGGDAQVEHRAGIGVGIRSRLGGVSEEESGLGIETSGRPDRLSRKPWKDVELARVDPTKARADVAGLVALVGSRWGVSRASAPTTPIFPPSDLRELFVETARAVGDVHKLTRFIVDPGQRKVSSPHPRLPLSTPSRPTNARSVSGSSQDGGAAAKGKHRDPVRRAASDLLIQVRHLEEHLRIKATPPLIVIPENSHEAGVVESPVNEITDPTGSPSRNNSAHSTPALGPVSLPGSRRLSSPSGDRPQSQASSFTDDLESLFSDDEDWSVNAFAREAERREYIPWEDRLLNEQREYRPVDGQTWSTINLPIREAVSRWAEVISRAIGSVPDRRSDAWVTNAVGSDAARARAFLVAHLSLEHAALLPPADDLKALLDRLSDGFLLVHAFNDSISVQTLIRRWGLIEQDVYDTLSEGPTGDSHTFKRVENLQCWAAALRQRYALPLNMPVNPTSITAPPNLPHLEVKKVPNVAPPSMPSGKRLDFSPLVVAKRLDGWEDMLDAVLNAWVSAAAMEALSDAPKGLLELQATGATEASVPDSVAEAAIEVAPEALEASVAMLEESKDAAVDAAE